VVETGCRRLGEHTVPVRDVLVCNARGDIEHDDAALAVDVVAIAEATELLLTSGIPDVKLNLAEVLREGLGSRGWALSSAGLTYRGEAKRVNLDTEGGHVLLLEFSRQVALDKGGLDVPSPCQFAAQMVCAPQPRSW